MGDCGGSRSWRTFWGSLVAVAFSNRPRLTSIQSRASRSADGSSFRCSPKKNRCLNLLDMQHRLSSVDPALAKATCRVCGVTDVIPRKKISGGEPVWVCKNRVAATEKKYRQRPEVRAKYLQYQASYRKVNATRVNLQIQEWIQAHPGIQREYNLQKFGLTPAEYEAQLVRQGSVCACCGSPPAAKRRLAVDHDHKTGRLRGLLCHRCNLGIGSLGDSIEGVERALAYLRQEGIF